LKTCQEKNVREANFFEPSFPNGEQRVQVSSQGGTEPRWRRDGRELLFLRADRVAASAGAPRLFVRALDALSARPLDGTEDASEPFWSLDSRSIAFSTDGDWGPVSVHDYLLYAESPEPREKHSHVKIGVNFFEEIRRRLAAQSQQ